MKYNQEGHIHDEKHVKNKKLTTHEEAEQQWVCMCEKLAFRFHKCADSHGFS